MLGHFFGSSCKVFMVWVKTLTNWPKQTFTDKFCILLTHSHTDYLPGLTELINGGANIYLGYGPSSPTPFKGCLRDVRLGGALLSFFDPSLFPSSSPFTAVSKDVTIGCVLCWDGDCHQGACYDREESYNCTCREGYEGEWCNVDMCTTKSPCENGGSCSHGEVVGIPPLLCSCPKGFTGNRYVGTVKPLNTNVLKTKYW